jgi:hypothetical protein
MRGMFQVTSLSEQRATGADSRKRTSPVHDSIWRRVRLRNKWMGLRGPSTPHRINRFRPSDCADFSG